MSGHNGARQAWTRFAWLAESTARYRRSLERSLPSLEQLAKSDERLVPLVDAIRTSLGLEVGTDLPTSIGSVAALDQLMSRIEPPAPLESSEEGESDADVR